MPVPLPEKKTPRHVEFESLVGLLALSVVLGACTAAATPEQRVVREAIAAMGGPAGIQAATILTLEGSGESFALGQNRTLDGDLLKWEVSDYRRSMDFPNRRWREESVYTPAFTTGWPDPFPVVAGFDQDLAYDVEDGTAQGLDAAAARDRRAELYHHPVGFLRAASAADATLENAQPSGDQHAVDLVPAEGERYTLTIDAGSGLPVRIVSKTHEPALGDVTVATEFGEFGEAAGLKTPGRITRRVDDRIVADYRITRTVVNPDSAELEAPEGTQAAAATPARVTVDELAPGIWYLTGEGHHSVVVEFTDHLTLVEAPLDDRRTLAVIARARELRPGKPLTEVVNTHHHFDHSGGIRAAISEGLKVITHEGNRGFVEQMAARPATVAPDALARNPKPLSLETVDERKVLTDGRRRAEIYPITGSSHSATMLMVYLPAERLLIEADAYQPPPLEGQAPVIHPFAANLLENIERRGLRVERLLPIHGRMVPFADLKKAAKQRGARP